MGHEPMNRQGAGGVHHWVARRMTGKQLWRGTYGIWRYPPLDESVAEAGLGGGGELCRPPPEHCRTAHLSPPNHWPVSGDIAAT